MKDIRHPKKLLDYRPIRNRRRRPGLSLKRQLGGYIREDETGHLLD
jgi:hypothetical protein